jgi:hypothetical protein
VKLPDHDYAISGRLFSFRVGFALLQSSVAS